MMVFAAVMGAAAVAAAVAFGIGNIDAARDFTRRLERRNRRAGPEEQAVAQQYHPAERRADVPPLQTDRQPTHALRNVGPAHAVRNISQPSARGEERHSPAHALRNTAAVLLGGG